MERKFKISKYNLKKKKSCYSKSVRSISILLHTFNGTIYNTLKTKVLVCCLSHIYTEPVQATSSEGDDIRNKKQHNLSQTPIVK